MHNRLLKLKSCDGLIGMWFHSLDADGDIDRQLQITRRSGDVYLCKIYSWEDGLPDACVAIHRNKILGLQLYETFEALNYALEQRVQMERYRQRQATFLLVSNNPDPR